MALPDHSLGLCDACQTPLIRNRRDNFTERTVTVEGCSPPENAYYPELSFTVYVVWCPACGWVKMIEAPQFDMLWINREYEERKAQAQD